MNLSHLQYKICQVIILIRYNAHNRINKNGKFEFYYK